METKRGNKGKGNHQTGSSLVGQANPHPLKMNRQGKPSFNYF